MLNGLRKVVHIEVFDFDSDTMAYATNSQKNQFGYKYHVDYCDGGKVVKSTEEVNNVEKFANYYNKFGINLSQMNSLKRRIRELRKKKMFPFPAEGGMDLVFRGGSLITYRGENKEEFYQKIIQLRK